MAWSNLQTRPGIDAGAGSVSTLADAYASNLTAGSLLLACVTWPSTTISVTVADPIHGAWTPVPGSLASGNTLRVQWFYVISATGGVAPTVTATASSAMTFWQIFISEYSGGLLPAAAAVGSNSTANPSVSIDPNLGGSLLIGGCYTVNALTAGASWTRRGAIGGNGTEEITSHNQDGSLIACDWTSGAGNWCESIIEFAAFQAAFNVRIPHRHVGPMALRHTFPRRPFLGDMPVVVGGTFNDSGSGSITLSGSGVETHVHTASGPGSLTLSGSGVETHTHSRSATGTITLSGSGTESQTHSRSATGSLTLSGSGTETHTHSSSGSGSITLSGSGVENYGYVDARVGSIVFSGTGSETQSHTGSRSGSIVLSGRGVESYSPPGGASAPADTLDQLHQIATWS